MKTSSFHSRPRGAQGPAISLAGLSPRAVADWWPPICRTAWSQPSSWPDSLVTHFFPGISMGSSVYCLLTPEVHQLPTPETSRPAAIPASPKSTTLPQPSDLDSSPPTVPKMRLRPPEGGGAARGMARRFGRRVPPLVIRRRRRRSRPGADGAGAGG